MDTRDPDIHGGVGWFLRQERERLGLSQRELAKRIGGGMSREYLAQVEKGKPGWPKKYITAIARELRVSEAELAERAGVILRDSQSDPRPSGHPDNQFTHVLPRRSTPVGTSALSVPTDADQAILDVVMAGVEHLTPDGLNELAKVVADIQRQKELEDEEPSP